MTGAVQFNLLAIDRPAVEGRCVHVNAAIGSYAGGRSLTMALTVESMESQPGVILQAAAYHGHAEHGLFFCSIEAAEALRQRLVEAIREARVKHGSAS